MSVSSIVAKSGKSPQCVRRLEQVAPFFIVSTGRSGTTMLRRLLNRHSQLCVPAETHFIARIHRPFLSHLQRGRRDRAIALINEQAIVKSWDITLCEADVAGLEGAAAYAEAIQVLMSRRAAQDGKPYWGDKTPHYIFDIALLRQLFPGARFIHMCRDGRDVALSILPLAFGPNNMYWAARWWQRHIRAWHAAVAEKGTGVIEIQYEQFCQEPERHLRQLCTFIGMPYEEAMLAEFRIKRDNSGKWRNKFHMSRSELAAFEAVAGDTLRAQGYETALSDPEFPLALRLFAFLDNLYKVLSNRILRRGELIG